MIIVSNFPLCHNAHPFFQLYQKRDMITMTPMFWQWHFSPHNDTFAVEKCHCEPKGCILDLSWLRKKARWHFAQDIKVRKALWHKGLRQTKWNAGIVSIPAFQYGPSDRIRTCGILLPKPRIIFFIALSNAFYCISQRLRHSSSLCEMQ